MTTDRRAPEDRGALVVKERAVATIVTTAALTVPAVLRQVGGMPRLTGRELPRADVSVGAHSVSVNLYVALAWPCTIPQVAETVHRTVEKALHDMTGLSLHRLNVVVAHAGSGTRTGNADTHREVSGSHPRTPPRPPTASPAAVPLAIALALTLLVVAFVAAREWLIEHEVIDGRRWISASIEWIGRLNGGSWILAPSACAVLLGAVLVVLALRPRTRTHTGAASTRASEGPVVWLRPTDVARMCSERARRVAGVRSARTTITPTRATVHVSPNSRQNVVEAVRTSSALPLSLLAEPRTVVVRVDRTRS